MNTVCEHMLPQPSESFWCVRVGLCAAAEYPLPHQYHRDKGNPEVCFDWIFILILREKHRHTLNILLYNSAIFFLASHWENKSGYKTSVTNLLAPLPPQYQY